MRSKVSRDIFLRDLFLSMELSLGEEYDLDFENNEDDIKLDPYQFAEHLFDLGFSFFCHEAATSLLLYSLRHILTPSRHHKKLVYKTRTKELLHLGSMCDGSD